MPLALQGHAFSGANACAKPQAWHPAKAGQAKRTWPPAPGSP